MKKPRFSIRYKILSMVTALLVAAIGFYLLLATQVFEQDKLELVFDLNKSVVTTLATEVDTALRGVTDKLRMYSLIVGSARNDKAARRAFSQVLTGDPFLVRIELYELGANNKMILFSKITDESFEKLYALNDEFYAQLLSKQRPIPFLAINANAVTVWNSTVENGPALIGVAIPVIKESGPGAPERIMAAVGYVKTDLFLKNLKSSNLTQAFIVGREGEVLIHPQTELMIQAADFSKLPIVAELKRAQAGVGVMEYGAHQEEQLGAYARVATGSLGVVSQIESKTAFMAARSLVKRSILFALIISTITFIATIIFSRSLTRPLQRLMSAMQKVSDGSLDIELKLGSRDEIAVLANSFNRMTADLKTSRYQLEEINRELENKVADRTKKLEEQNHAVKEAQEALLRTTRLASVGEIAGRTAHEVLNPLTSLMARVQKVQKRLNEGVINNKNLFGEIVSAWRQELSTKGAEGFTAALSKASSIDPQISLLQEDLANLSQIFSSWDQDLSTLGGDAEFVMQQAARIDKILRQMRSLSIVSSQKATAEVHPILSDAINILGDLFSRNKIKVVKNFFADAPEVKLDRDEFIQVLTNMFRNALQAIHERNTPQFLGVVRIDTRTEAGRLIIDITDNGVGISAENQAKLFESQFSTKTPELGTGLGLSISRRFVRAFDGDLHLVSSTRGEGTTFRIELPLVGGNKMGARAA